MGMDEVHKRGLWHRAIVVAIINEKNEVLLQQRSFNKEKNAGMWDISVAGHISTGQDSLSAAAREINEEVTDEKSSFSFYHSSNFVNRYVYFNRLFFYC